MYLIQYTLYSVSDRETIWTTKSTGCFQFDEASNAGFHAYY